MPKTAARQSLLTAVVRATPSAAFRILTLARRWTSLSSGTISPAISPIPRITSCSGSSIRKQSSRGRPCPTSAFQRRTRAISLLTYITNERKSVMSDEKQNEQLSRRGFLRGVFIATASIPVAAAGCAPTDAQTAPPAGYQPAPLPPLNEDVPLALDVSPNPTMLRTFTSHEARTVEAVTARIMPGTPDDPGAREAGVVIYIDNMLSYSEGFVESTYREPPYVQMYEGETPPESD